MPSVDATSVGTITVSKLIGATITALTSVVLTMPESIALPAKVLAVMIAFDTMTGIGTAIVCGKQSSHTMTTRGSAKALQYMYVAFAGGMLSILAQTPLIFGGALGYLICNEFNSIMENIARLGRHGGVKFDRLKPFTAFISQYVDLEAPRTTTTVTSATTFPSSPSMPGDVVSVVQMDTTSRTK